MTPKKPIKRPSGAEQRKAAGLKTIVLGLAPELVERIDRLAAADMRTRTNWIVYQLDRITTEAEAKE